MATVVVTFGLMEWCCSLVGSGDRKLSLSVQFETRAFSLEVGMDVRAVVEICESKASMREVER